MLGCMCESLSRYVNDVMVVRVFFFNGLNYKITNLSLCIKK